MLHNFQLLDYIFTIFTTEQIDCLVTAAIMALGLCAVFVVIVSTAFLTGELIY